MIPAAFQPRTDDSGEHFTLLQKRGWAPWILGLLSATAMLMGVALLIDVPAGGLLFFPLGLALGWAGVRQYSNEITEIAVTRSETELRWLDVAIPLAELEEVVVLGDEEPQLLVRYGEGRTTIVPAMAHEIGDARELAAALTASR